MRGEPLGGPGERRRFLYQLLDASRRVYGQGTPDFFGQVPRLISGTVAALAGCHGGMIGA